MTEQGFPVNSRFRITSSPEILPGKCAVCGAVDRPVVDFSTTIPMFGAILLCFSCLQEAARGVGMVPRTELEAAQENLAQSLELQLRRANMIGVPRERFDDIVVAVSGLSDALLFGDSRSSTILVGSHGEIQPPLFDDDATGNPDAEGLSEGDTGSPEQDNNPVVSEGPVIISSGDSDGKSRIRSI
jgi:hypothetical protein